MGMTSRDAAHMLRRGFAWIEPTLTRTEPRRAGPRLAAVSVFAVALMLAGCGSVVEETVQPQAEAVPGRTIEGRVHGGVYPIRNATVKLMQTVTFASTKDVYGNTITPGNTYGATAATLLTTTSDQNGYFTFPDTGWSCGANEFAYIVVTGGHSANVSTVTANSNVVQIGVIGPCSSVLANQGEIDKVNVFVSELSTVAAAAALDNFMTVTDPADGTADQVVNIGAPKSNMSTGACSSSTGCTAAGLAHAFANAALLVDSVRTDGTFPSGFASSGNATNSVVIPSPLINTMADILQQCVDSQGLAMPTPNACSTLFTNATAPGATKAPNNTLQVALNMVQYPSNNVSHLFGSVAPTVPFTPSLAAAPESFAVSIFHGVSYVQNANGTYTGTSVIPVPLDVALDATDQAYVLYTGPGQMGTGIAQWTANSGLVTTGTLNTTYTSPSQIALDFTGLVYVTNNNASNTTNDAVLRLSGTTLYPVAGLKGASGLAFDSANDVFVSSVNTGTASVTEYTQANLNLGLSASMFVGGSVTPSISATSSSATRGQMISLAVDSNQNIWGAGLSGTANAFLWPKTSSKSAPYTSGGGSTNAFTQGTPFSLALNSAGKAYFPVNGAVASGTYISSTFNINTAEAVSTNTGESALATSKVPYRAQVDGLGNLFWSDNESTGLVYRYAPGSGSVAGTVSAFLPCFTVQAGSEYYWLSNNGSTGSTSVAANFRGMSIDSAGDLWYVANAGYGALIETLGVAAPTWPLLSYGHPGVRPQ